MISKKEWDRSAKHSLTNSQINHKDIISSRFKSGA